MTYPQEAAALVRDLPAAAQAEFQPSDAAFVADLVGSWQRQGVLTDVDPALFAALPCAIPALMRQRIVIGDGFPRLLGLVIDSLADALTPARNVAGSRRAGAL